MVVATFLVFRASHASSLEDTKLRIHPEEVLQALEKGLKL